MRASMLLFVVLMFFSGPQAFSQEDSVENRVFKNTIYYNVSNPLIFGFRSIIFGWERQLSNDRSFSINFGKPSYPGEWFFDYDSLKLLPDYTEHGVHLSGEYRKYLSNLNAHSAPRGVYFGLYASTNNFKRKLEWEITKASYEGNVFTDLGINIHSMGVELGYQFVFKDRWTLDLVLMGPGIALYNFKATIGSDLSPEQEQELIDNLNDYLSTNFPAFDRLFDNGEFKRTGSTSTLSLGFRYLVTVGYRF